MRLTRTLTMAATALVGIGLLTAPPASAATTVTVDCGSSDTESFTVSPGEPITFILDDLCYTLLDDAGFGGSAFADFVASIVQNQTGAAIVSTWAANPTIVYTAGSTPGTDSLILSTDFRYRLSLSRGYRIADTVNAYYMTVPGSAPPSWLQAIGRPDKDAPCPQGWGPSWAEWPNNGTGGFVCVREYYYDLSSGTWSYR